MINELISIKNDIKSAIEEKNIVVTGGLSTYADAIKEINVYGDESQYVIPADMTLTHSYDLNPLYKYIIEKRTNCDHLFDHGYFSDVTPIEELLDTSNVVTMNHMFKYCSNITTAPMLNTSSVKDMSWMFYACDNLTTIPQFDTSNVTNMSYMFYGCDNLKSLPLLDTSNVADFKNFFGNENTATNEMLSNLTDLGGFINLGAAFSKPYYGDDLVGMGFLWRCPNLTHTSIMNVINNLYDCITGSGTIGTIYTLRVNSNTLALLSEEDIAIATNKGWNIVV
jgi:surface protein